jgi:hypothetical protein
MSPPTIEKIDDNHQNHLFDKCLGILYNKVSEKSSLKLSTEKQGALL